MVRPDDPVRTPGIRTRAGLARPSAPSRPAPEVVPHKTRSTTCPVRGVRRTPRAPAPAAKAAVRRGSSGAPAADDDQEESAPPGDSVPASSSDCSRPRPAGQRARASSQASIRPRVVGPARFAARSGCATSDGPGFRLQGRFLRRHAFRRGEVADTVCRRCRLGVARRAGPEAGSDAQTVDGDRFACR
jgi:hypothetical protein